MSEHGPLIARYQVSASDQRALAHLRTVCAVLALLGAGAVMLGSLPLSVFMVALLAVAVSLGWLAQAKRLRREAAQREPASLAVYGDGFARHEEHGNEWLSWTDVARVEVDEERLDVLVHKADGSTLRIEPKYAGVDIYQLVRTLDNARASAQGCQGHVDSEPATGSPGWRP